MKQTCVTALLLWLMLAGVCRGQGKNRLGVVVAPLACSFVQYYPKGTTTNWGISSGISYERRLGKYLGIEASMQYRYQKGGWQWDSTYNAGHYAWFIKGKQNLHYLQFPCKVNVHFNTKHAIEWTIGMGMQYYTLLNRAYSQSMLTFNETKQYTLVFDAGMFMPIAKLTEFGFSIGYQQRIHKEKTDYSYLFWNKAIALNCSIHRIF